MPATGVDGLQGPQAGLNEVKPSNPLRRAMLGIAALSPAYESSTRE
jgi:hypothetical protein